MKNVLAIAGSLRSGSTALKVIKTIAQFGIFNVEIFNGLEEIPPFNPDKKDNVPKQVVEFRQKLQAADGVIICSPEYVFAVPGALKNAIDWTVSSGEFYGKAVSIIVASTSGEKAFESLQLITKTLMARIENTCLLISGAKSKFDNSDKLTDLSILEMLKGVTVSLNNEMNKENSTPL